MPCVDLFNSLSVSGLRSLSRASVHLGGGDFACIEVSNAPSS